MILPSIFSSINFDLDTIENIRNEFWIKTVQNAHLLCEIEVFCLKYWANKRNFLMISVCNYLKWGDIF